MEAPAVSRVQQRMNIETTKRGKIIEAFFKAYQAEPEAPCDRYSCAMKDKCAAELLACSSFRIYVEHGRVLNPAYTYDSAGKMLDEESTPTAQMYVLIMDSDRALQPRKEKAQPPPSNVAVAAGEALDALAGRYVAALGCESA